MKLLVPVDGSTASINAAEKAFEIARQYNFSIKLISVIKSSELKAYKRNINMWRQSDGSILNKSTQAIDGDYIIETMENRAMELLNSMADELDSRDLQIEKAVLEGEPYVEILEVAKNENFDLIVMGNRGLSKIKRFFLGSVTQRVLSEAPCPVLVIHSEAED